MRARKRGRAGTACVVVAVALALGACATPDTAQAPDLQPPELPAAFPRSADGIVVPTPEATDVAPDLGPAATAPPAATGNPTPAAPIADPQPDIAGYTGDDWSDQADDQVSVVAESVTLRDGVAMGLVRNGRTTPVGPITVAVGDAVSTVSLPVLRPGEPAPFVVEVGAETTVEELEFTVDAPVTTSSPPRGLRLRTFWQRGIDDPREVDTYLYVDEDPGPGPAVAFGQVDAAEAVEGLVVIAAWMASDGRVVAVDESGQLQRTALAPGESGDFVVVGDGDTELDDARLVLWGSGS